MKLPISANLVVYNEAHRIDATLKAIRPHVDEIVLVDQSSTDGTWDLASYHVDKLLKDPAWGRCEPSRERAAQESKHEWILVVDADERLESEGWESIRWVIEDDEADVVYFMIANYVGGRFVQTDVMACPRLFKRNSVNFASHLHGIITPKNGARGLTLDEFVIFLHEKTVEEQQADWDRYSRLEGVDRGTWSDESHY